jgi:hypothetical protein
VLYRQNLTLGTTRTIGATGNGGEVNSMGYNVLDNFLYAYSLSDNKVIRIHSDATYDNVSTLAAATLPRRAGEIDTDGQMWLTSNDGTQWAKVNLNPGSSTFGTIVDSGTSTGPGIYIADWVYLPVAGDYLYSIGVNQTSGISSQLRWSRTTHVWSYVETYTAARIPTTRQSFFGAMYGMNNNTGTIYAQDTTTGKIFQFPRGGTPFLLTTGTPSTQSDGARCVLNTNV